MHNLIPSLSDTPIRIGFGKIDSVPTAQPSASTQQYSLSNSSASSIADHSDVESQADSDADERRQSFKQDEVNMPTRALWLGSIPANVTSDTLTSLFSAFGSIESARTLTSKQCGFGMQSQGQMSRRYSVADSLVSHLSQFPRCRGRCLRSKCPQRP
jgi:RNA recognition motif-containing protein